MPGRCGYRRSGVACQAQRLAQKRGMVPSGGFMELGETPEQGALRELKEETGLTGRIDMLLGVSANPSSQYHTVLMVGYLVKSYSGDLIAGDDADDAEYFHYHELPEIAFESHAGFIRMYYAAFSP